MSVIDRDVSKRFWPENLALFFRRRIFELLGLSLLLAMLLLAGAIFSYSATDPSMNTVGPAKVENFLGIPGAIVADLLLQTIGLANIAIMFVLGVWGFRLITRRIIGRLLPRLFCLPIALVLVATMFAPIPTPVIWPLETGLGGVAGMVILQQLVRLEQILELSSNVTMLVIVPLGLLTLFWCLGVKWGEWLNLLAKMYKKSGSLIKFGTRGGLLGGRFVELTYKVIVSATQQRFSQSKNRSEPTFSKENNCEDAIDSQTDEKGRGYIRLQANSFLDAASNGSLTPKPSIKLDRKAKKRNNNNEQVSLDLTQAGEYQFPAIDLLSIAKQKSTNSPDKATLEANARLLEIVLQDFGVKGEIVQVRSGPVVTLYELEPAPGTKSSRVIGLADDIARSMSAVSVRVAVVPGRNVIGIELPNPDREMVFLRELFQSGVYADCKEKLPIALGKDISGEPIVVDLARMPHLLIAGTTGSGKSVAVNTMILSLLYRMKPEQCRMIMIDPKMLELSIYDNIPHLLSPVVTDPKKAVVALKWTVREMESRYRAMSKLGVRNIDGYNARLAQARAKGEILKRRVQTGFDNETGKPVFEDQPLDLTPLPYIVVVIDEVADLMLVAGKDIEGAVQRLAQMARAAGIHVIMATQRPSVDVITGTIKANFPTRISFQVTSKIDSRTILGEQGAEQLLGQGDMLHMAGGGKVTRVHGPFVSDEEVEDVVLHLKSQGEPEFNESITEEDDVGDPLVEYGLGLGEKGGERGDELYDEAVAVVARERKASTSFIQRHLKIGYNRAATIIDRMENEGVVTSANHVGKRQVLLPDHSEL